LKLLDLARMLQEHFWFPIAERPYQKRVLPEGGPKQRTEDERKKGKKNYLPTVAAVAAIATIAAAAATSTAAAIATAAATTPAISTATTAPRGTFRLRARFVHNKVPTTEVLTVEAVDRAIGVFVTGDLDEREAARLARETVTDQTNCRRIDTSLPKPFL
jgi:hypothetical protein